MGGNDGAATDKGNKTSPFNEANMIFPQSMDELPDELCQKLQAKLDADVKAFLESCTKNWHDKVNPPTAMLLLPHLQTPGRREMEKLSMLKR